jgi:hypothetical protein
MISYLKDISLFLIIAIIVNLISNLMGTDFLLNYLKGNLINIQLTLMAINTATCGLIVSKLQEIKERHKEVNVKPITKSLLDSLKEQIILIVLGAIFALIIDSKFTAQFIYSEYINFSLHTLLMAVFVNSVQILWDTGKSIFVIIDIMDEISKKD